MDQDPPDGQSRSFSVASAVATTNKISNTFPAHAASFVAKWEREIVRTASFNAARLAQSSTDTRTMAQELAQAARIRVAMLRDTTMPKSYVRAVIRNAMIRLVRNERASFGQLSPLRVPLPDDIPAETGEGLAARREDVATWVRTLRPPLRRVFTLLYEEGKTQREAAVALGVSQPRVAQLHEALKAKGRAELQHLAA